MHTLSYYYELVPPSTISTCVLYELVVCIRVAEVLASMEMILLLCIVLLEYVKYIHAS